MAAGDLQTGDGRRPHYSLRTLTRALDYTRRITRWYGVQRALYEGIATSFLTVLGGKSRVALEESVRSACPPPRARSARCAVSAARVQLRVAVAVAAWRRCRPRCHGMAAAARGHGASRRRRHTLARLRG